MVSKAAISSPLPAPLLSAVSLRATFRSWALSTGIYAFHEEEWAHVSAEAKDLVAKMLTVDPDERPSAAELLQHP